MMTLHILNSTTSLSYSKKAAKDWKSEIAIWKSAIFKLLLLNCSLTACELLTDDQSETTKHNTCNMRLTRINII